MTLLHRANDIAPQTLRNSLPLLGYFLWFHKCLTSKN